MKGNLKYNYMKKLLLLVLVGFIHNSGLYSQISEGGIPPSFEFQDRLRSTRQIQTVSFDRDLKTLLWEDSIAEKNGSPMRIAISLPANIDINATGEWTTLPNKQRIWRQTVHLPDARGSILEYEDFYIPEGGKLFIYNKDKSQVIGAYTENTNPEGGQFSNEVIFGDEVTLEYVESLTSIEQPRIKVAGLGYVYPRTYTTEGKKLKSDVTIGQSDVCLVNVNCPEGDNWRNQQRGVVHIIMAFGSEWYVCSGSLVNNTKNDQTPYILTANHCFYEENSNGKVTSTASFKTAQFYFNYEHPGCVNLNVVPSTLKSVVGSDPLTRNSIEKSSDGLLLLLKSSIPLSWNPYYNGWDNQDIAPESGVIIHHPSGDVKKISTYTTKATSTSWNDNVGTVKNTHWSIKYATTTNGKSVTEGGSSGSPMFNQNGLIVGTLSGGSSYCKDTYDWGQLIGGPNDPDLYGKLAYHWNKDSSAAGQMQPYLDPLNSGVKTLAGYDPNNPSGIDKDKSEKINLVIFPNPAEDELNVNARGIIKTIKGYDMLGRLIYSADNIGSSTATFTISSWNRGTYNIVIETEEGVLSQKVVKK